MGAEWATGIVPDNKSTDPVPIRRLSLHKKLKRTEEAFESMVQLELHFQTSLPASLKHGSSKYRIRYEVFYGSSCDRWVENATNEDHTSKRAFSFDYSISQDDQNIYVKISFDISKDSISRQATVGESTDFADEDFNLEQDGFIHKVDAKFDLHTILLQKGKFGVAEYLSSNIFKETSGEQAFKGLDKYESDSSIVKASIMEKNPHSKSINFELVGKFTSEEGFLMVTVYEEIGNHRKLIFETTPIKKSIPQNGRTGLFYFDKVELNSSVFESEFLSTVVLEFELKRVKYHKGKPSYKILGSETAKLKNILNLHGSKQMQLSIMN